MQGSGNDDLVPPAAWSHSKKQNALQAFFIFTTPLGLDSIDHPVFDSVLTTSLKASSDSNERRLSCKAGTLWFHVNVWILSSYKLTNGHDSNYLLITILHCCFD